MIGYGTLGAIQNGFSNCSLRVTVRGMILETSWQLFAALFGHCILEIFFNLIIWFEASGSRFDQHELIRPLGPRDLFYRGP